MICLYKSKTNKKTRSRVTTPSNASYEDLFGKVTEKVDKYNSIMEAREAGKSKEIPVAVVARFLQLSALPGDEVVAGVVVVVVPHGVSKVKVQVEDAVIRPDGYILKRVHSPEYGAA